LVLDGGLLAPAVAGVQPRGRSPWGQSIHLALVCAVEACGSWCCSGCVLLLPRRLQASKSPHVPRNDAQDYATKEGSTYLQVSNCAKSVLVVPKHQCGGLMCPLIVP
jgi:hypothetical protein